MTTDMLDLEEELPRRERRQLVTPAGVAAAAVAIAAAGVFGGVQVQKSRGDSGGGTGTRAGGFGAASGGQRTGAQGQTGAGGQGQAGGATVGEVASIDGSALYVDDSSGTTIKVKLAKGGTVN